MYNIHYIELFNIELTVYTPCLMSWFWENNIAYSQYNMNKKIITDKYLIKGFGKSINSNFMQFLQVFMR